MAEIRLQKLTKKFGSVTAVDGINLDIHDGELLALLGPSGCGKTTCLLMLAGIYKPTAGEIFFDDVVVNDVPPKGRSVGLVFQSYALYPHMTVYDNIAFPLRIRRTPKQEIDRRVREVAKIAQIDELLARRPSQLSGGQQQRVAIARALCMQPEIMLFDEPTSALDPEMIKEVLDVMVELAGSGMTMLCVTHEMGFAREVADRIVFMDGGRIVEDTATAAFFEAPQTERARQFLGQILAH